MSDSIVAVIFDFRASVTMNIKLRLDNNQPTGWMTYLLPASGTETPRYPLFLRP